MFSEIYILYIFLIYMYTRAFLLHLSSLLPYLTDAPLLLTSVYLYHLGLLGFISGLLFWKNAIPLNVTSPPFHYSLNFIQVINFTMFPFLNVLERSESVSPLVVSDSLQSHGLQPARLLCPWDFLARILEWVAIPFFRGSSLPRD